MKTPKGMNALVASRLVEKRAEATLPTEHGEFELIVYSGVADGAEHVALVRGNWLQDEPVLVRIHSQCLTGDAFASQRCDCGEQLQKSLELIGREEGGVLLYLQQEGRGIGLTHKVLAYKLQENGLDTVQANEALGFNPDERDYTVAGAILSDLGIKKIRLLTNNPGKISNMNGYGIEVVERVPLKTSPNKHNARYLQTKREKMGHLL